MKPYKSHADQVDLLASRGMDVGDRSGAIEILTDLNYYRLSGYWYLYRELGPQGGADTFVDGTRLADVLALYDFDQRLRAATWAGLAPVETTVRALLGHHLGAVAPNAHEVPSLLSARARTDAYVRWLGKYEQTVRDSRDDYVVHHRTRYGGKLPVWVAVELLDWGSLSRLYQFSPDAVQKVVAEHFELSAPQLGSWLRSLNIVRNICAHHGRLFNRAFALQAKMPKASTRPDLARAATDTSKVFGQLSLIQYILRQRGLGDATLLPGTLASFPNIARVSVRSTGAPEDWEALTLWR